MIYFDTSDWELCNYILHRFFDVEGMSISASLEDKIVKIVPLFFRRDHYELCEQGFRDLYIWSQDDFFHQMRAVHEYLLYYFIDYISKINNSTLKELYFDKKCNKLIYEAAKKSYENDDDIELENLIELYYDLDFYSDKLFEDIDFLAVEALYNFHSEGNDILITNLGMDLDYYFEILPLDIQQKYKTGHILLYGDIFEMVVYLMDRIEHGDLLKLIWNDNQPVYENEIQLIFDVMISAYFETQEIELVWHSLIVEQRIIFEFWKRRQENKKNLLSIRVVNENYLEKGFEEVLISQSENYERAFHLFISFTDEQYNAILNFQRQYIFTDTLKLYLNFYIVDARKKPTASKI
mgnify:CR=1 FL=1